MDPVESLGSDRLTSPLWVELADQGPALMTKILHAYPVPRTWTQPGHLPSLPWAHSHLFSSLELGVTDDVTDPSQISPDCSLSLWVHYVNLQLIEKPSQTALKKERIS